MGGKLRSLILAFLAVVALCAGAGNGVSLDGGGGNEQALLYSWANLEHFLAPCLADASCYRTESGRKLLSAIAHDHAQETARGGLEFFEDENSPLKVTTEPRVAAPLKINLSTLYPNILTVNEALAFLLNALAQHHPELQTPEFTGTLSGLQQLWSSRVEARDLSKIGHGGISVMVVQGARISVLAGDGAGYQDVLAYVEGHLVCAGAKAQITQLRRMYWQEIVALNAESVGLPIYGQIAYLCEGKTMRADVRLLFRARVLEGDSAKFLAKPGNYSLEITLQTPTVQLFDLHEDNR